MSTSHKISANRRSASRLPWLVAACSVVSSISNAQLSSDDVGVLMARQKDGADPHEIALAMSGVERSLKEGSEALKLSGALQAIDLAASIYRTYDTTVPTDRSLGRWPDFDATSFGGKPVFAGTDPSAIADPNIKAAYEQALANHERLLARVSAELHKLDEGDYCARVAYRVIESSANRAALSEMVGDHIASIDDAPWIRERLAQILLQEPQSKEQSPPMNDSGESGSTSRPQSGATTPPPRSVNPPAPKTAHDTKSTTSTPIKEAASSTPWSIIVVLILAAPGLVWLLLRGRK